MNRMKTLAALALTAGMLLSAHAQATSPAQTPWPLTDLFETPPPAAHATSGSSCVVAERYAQLGNAKRVTEIGALFASDAVFLDPSGKLIEGRDAIGAWFAGHSGHNTAIPLSFIAIGRECFMEAASHSDHDPDPRYRLMVIDHFTVNARGEIARAVYYFRPATLAAVQRLAPPPNGH